MAEIPHEELLKAHLIRLTDALERDDGDTAARLLKQRHPAEIADLLESLPQRQRLYAWELVPPELDGEVLVELGDEVRASLLQEMDAKEIHDAAISLDVDDQADFVQGLPEPITDELLARMDEQNRLRLESLLSYPEDTAGGLMDTDPITVRADVSLEVVLRYLRFHGDIGRETYDLFVVNREDRYLGLLSLSTLVSNELDLTVAEVIDQSVEGIPAELSAREVARLFQDRDLVSAPVIDEQGKLLGRITVDDVVDVIREEADHAVLSRAGLSEEEDIFAPVWPSARRRAVWLGVNLLTAFLAAWVIGLFAATLDQVVALAILMPVVASMGGIAGSQTLTLVIRGIALGQLGRSNARFLLSKEVAVGLLNGMVWAIVVAAAALLWFRDYTISAVIAAALIINLFAAAGSGVAIPLLLKKMRIDPALAGGVILTTVTDVIGFVAFLGLATLAFR